MHTQPFRAGYVAIVGDPNVGKSTLMNALVGEKISIVTNKPQTTRQKIIGILSKDHYQIIFFDTPGMVKPKYLLHESMMNVVAAAIADADIVLFMLDCTSVKPDDDIARAVVGDRLHGLSKPVYLLINKIDTIHKDDLIPLIAVFSKHYAFKEVFPISALKAIGTGEMLDHIVNDLPEHSPYYPPEMFSEHPERFFVGEIIREKIFEKFHEEIPYSTAVDIIDFKENKGRKDLIEAEIYVDRDSQKGILIGSGGTALKEIGELARKDIEAFLQRPVFLNLHVKVREKWREKKEWLRRLGY